MKFHCPVDVIYCNNSLFNLVQVVAGCEMAGRYLPKLWFLFFTQLGCISASCSEPASAGRIQRAGNIAFRIIRFFLRL